ncbi:MAG: YkgJ family cysteine cluster protein [Methanocella sp.]
MTVFTSFSFDVRMRELNDELSGLAAYPMERFLEIVKEVGFECNLCGKCCTRDFNDHAFLLDDDAERIGDVDKAALIPAPYYEFCDQAGTFYVSGYAIRANHDGTCHFLEKGRCRIYEQRPRICRIYPYMLHREEDEAGEVDWRQISGLNRHGYYNSEVDDAECRQMWEEVKDYEAGFLKQEIAFMEAVKAHFEANGLKHSPMAYDRQMRIFGRGGKVHVNVFYKGGFRPHAVTKKDY